MKIKDTYILRNVAGQNIVVALGGENIDFNSVITLNDTGAFIFRQMEKHTDKDSVINALLSEYDIDRSTAENDFDIFIKKLRDNSMLE